MNNKQKDNLLKLYLDAQEEMYFWYSKLKDNQNSLKYKMTYKECAERVWGIYDCLVVLGLENFVQEF